MIITVCGKIMKNLRKRINARVVNNEKDDYEKKKKRHYEILKRTADPWFCISCTSNILPFRNRHGKAKKTITIPTNPFHHNELFQLIKNLSNLTDESSNDDTNSLNFSNKYRGPEYFCHLQGNIKSKSASILHHNVCSLWKNFDQLPCTSDRTWHRLWLYSDYRVTQG